MASAGPPPLGVTQGAASVVLSALCAVKAAWSSSIACRVQSQGCVRADSMAQLSLQGSGCW